MSGFKSPQFVKEFAYRTMVNYLNLKNMKHNGKILPEVQCILDEMSKQGFDDLSQEYEVTLAINSLMGLLIFPQQEYYHKIINDTDFDKLQCLEQCIRDDQKFKYYYFVNRNGRLIKEEPIPSNILRHMRNAVAHERVMIIPESCSGKKITHIRFRDACYYINGNKRDFKDLNLDKQIKEKLAKSAQICEFDFRIEVDKLELVLFEIARYLINHQI